MIEDKNVGNKDATATCREDASSDSRLHETETSSDRSLYETGHSSTEYRPENATSDGCLHEADSTSTEYRDETPSDPELREGGAAARLPEEDGLYTYADYCTWDDDKSWELIDGIAYAMAAPTIAHQRISWELSLQLGIFLRGKSCQPFHAPFDVRLFANQDDETDESDDTVVQPDLLVVCDRSKLSDGRSCKGAPDLIVEILSPSTSRKDRLIKLQKYREAGVREYWIVDPDKRTVLVYLFEDEKISRTKYDETDSVPVTVLPGLMINLPGVFAEMM